MNPMSAFLPSHSATLLVVHLNEFAKATGIVVVGGLGVPKSLQEQKKVCKGENRRPSWLALSFEVTFPRTRFITSEFTNSENAGTGAFGKKKWG